ncbi:MAG: hypothetical protein ACLU37_03600 [Collinsella sp.]
MNAVDVGIAMGNAPDYLKKARRLHHRLGRQRWRRQGARALRLI